jgi:hypothetical protein
MAEGVVEKKVEVVKTPEKPTQKKITPKVKKESTLTPAQKRVATQKKNAALKKKAAANLEKQIEDNKKKTGNDILGLED